MGKNTLSKFVKTKCNKAGKERRKINHSARKTTLTLLVNAVVPPIYPSFAYKRSQKRPILYIINTSALLQMNSKTDVKKSFLMSLLETTILQ